MQKYSKYLAIIQHNASLIYTASIAIRKLFVRLMYQISTFHIIYDDHHSCTPSLRMTLPTSSSLLPSKTPLVKLPATDGSPAPIRLLTS